MKTGLRVFKNTVSLILGKALGDLASFFFLIYFARVFGIAVFGQYIFAMSLGGFLSILVNFGLNTLAVREISRDKSVENKYIGNLLATQCLLAALSWSLIAVFVLLSGMDLQSRMIVLTVGAYQVLYMLNKLVNARFQAHEDMEYSALLEISHKLFILVFGSLLIAIWGNPIVALLTYPVSAMGMVVLGVALSNRRYGKPKLEIDGPFVKRLLSDALPFFVLIILFEVYDRVGIVVLSFIEGDESTGIYAAADRLLVPLTTAVGMFSSALFPVFSRYARESRESLIIAYNRSARIAAVIVLPVSTFLFLLSQPIVAFVYGAEFSDAGPVLEILSWVILPIGLSSVLSRVLVALDEQRSLVRIQLWIYSGFLAACFALIPSYSYSGLAIAKLAAAVALFAAYSWHLSKMIPQGTVIRSALSPLFACLAAILVFHLLKPQSLWLNIPVSVCVCAVALFISGGIKWHDLQYLKKAFQR